MSAVVVDGKGLGDGAEFERTTKSEDENEHEKEALCKIGV